LYNELDELELGINAFDCGFDRNSKTATNITLKQHAVDCNTVNSFKRCLDRCIKDRGFL